MLVHQRTKDRKISLALLANLAILLQGCVTSQVPLLDDSSPIADPAFTGHYEYVDPQQKTSKIDVFLKDNLYLLVEGGKLKAIVTLHAWDAQAGVQIAQLRNVGKREYGYFLIRRTNEGAELNLIPCKGDFSCTVTKIHDLSNLTAGPLQDFKGREYLQAIKLGELNE